MCIRDRVSVTGLAAPSKEYTVTFQAGAHGKLYGMTSRGVAEGTVLTADLIPTCLLDTSPVEGHRGAGLHPHAGHDL